MKRLMYILLIAVCPLSIAGCGGGDISNYAFELSSFGERNFDKLDRNHDGTVIESELWEAQATNEYTSAEKQLIKMIRDNLSSIGHVTDSEKYQSIDPIALPDGNGGITWIYIPSTKTRYLYGVNLADFKNFGMRQTRR